MEKRKPKGPSARKCIVIKCSCATAASWMYQLARFGYLDPMGEVGHLKSSSEVGHLQLQATIPFFFCLLLFCLLIYFSIYIDASSTYWKVMIMMDR
jgi:hypothetical protein